MPTRFTGSSTSQKRKSSAEAATVKTMRHSAPKAGYQSKSTSAEPTNSSAMPVQKVATGNGALNIVRRWMWSST